LKLQPKINNEQLHSLNSFISFRDRYQQGMLRARADDRETIQLIEGATAGMIATVEGQGYDALEDWEVDELLDWTTSLNFDEYV
jgi:hypothetical protein